MKMNKLIAAGVLAVAFTGAASAQTVIRLTGATAFRAATHNAIIDVLDGEVYGYAGSSLGSANRSVFTGTVNGQPVTISCRWSGSVGGITDLAQDRSYTDFPRNDGTLTSAGKPNHTATEGFAALSDIAFSDSYASSTGIPGSDSLVSTPVGVVPFFFVKSKSNNASVQTVLNKINNISIIQAQTLLSGEIRAGQLTGVDADSSVALYPIGRDADSGTRLGVLFEAAYFTNPTQYKTTYTGGLISGVTADVSGGGYSSNSFTATDLKSFISATATVDYGYGDGAQSGIDFALIGYIGLSDVVSSANNLQSQVLSYNGVNIFSNVGGVWTPNWDLLYSGAYTLWTYEHILWRSDIDNDPIKAEVGLALASAIDTHVTAPSGLQLSNMKVARSIEGGPITHN